MPVVILRKPVLAAAVLALCGVAALAIWTIVFHRFDEFEIRVVVSTTALAIYGLLALPAGLLFGRRRHLLLATANAAFSVGAFLLTLFVLWFRLEQGPSPVTWKALLTVSLLAAATAQAGAVELRRSEFEPRSLRVFAVLAGVAGFGDAVLGSIAGILEIHALGFYRVVAVVAVLDALLLAILPIVRRAAR